jgi:His-Xaa-Ser system radical SAM maturase HxsC
VGGVTPLALTGKALSATVSAGGQGRRVFRLNSPHTLPSEFNPRHDAALAKSESEVRLALESGFGSVLALAAIDGAAAADCAFQVGDQFAYLAPGDVVGFDSASHRFRSLFRRGARHNSFLVTERCNNYCLMCSQPPKDVNDSWLMDEIAQALRLIDPSAHAITFTGGEPLTDVHRFLDLIALTKTLLPQTAIHVLTNGRAFANPEVAAAWAALEHPNLSAGIPVYAAVDQVHDHVVQAKGAFDETILGILRLKDLGQNVQIRLVLHALTTPRLRETAEWFARNLPFVDHIALMGLENTGFAIANDKQLWIDPMDYQADLAYAVEVLSAARVNVSVFNLPLCVLDPAVRPYAVQSISDWKNAYVDECDSCAVREQCAGFFSSGRLRWRRKFGQLAKVGSTSLKDGLYDWEAEAVLG